MSAPQRPGPPPPWPPQPPPHGRPGATEWIPRVQEPRRDEPFRFSEPARRPPANPVATWALRVAGLVAVAVVSGFLWAYLRDDPPPPAPAADDSTTTPEVPPGRFEFSPHEDMPEPRRDTDCAANSRGQVREFFVKHQCVSLVRALYTSRPPGQDERIYTWVAVVEMESDQLATELHDLAQTDNTGNVEDPITAGIVEIKGIGTQYGLGGGGYNSALHEKHVIIVESDWAPSGKRSAAEDEFLTEVSADAIRFGKQFTTQG